MLDALFNDSVSVRRLSGQRDGHGKPTYKVVVEKDTNGDDTDVPVFIDCFIDRRRRVSRSLNESVKSVDATLQYNVGEAATRLAEQDLIVVESTGETFRVETLHEQVSSAEGSEYAVVTLVRIKAPVAPNTASSSDV
ncbi:hypothetical protein EHM76_06735 [bacterium]|nr:MAG: hypothetical protein EHM76_06735 [bacterium]